MQIHEDVPAFSLLRRREARAADTKTDEDHRWIENLRDFTWTFALQFHLLRVAPRVSGIHLHKSEEKLGRDAWAVFSDLRDTVRGPELQTAGVESELAQGGLFYLELNLA